MTRPTEITLFVVIAAILAGGAWWLSSHQVKAPTAGNTHSTTTVEVAYIAIGDDGKAGEKIGCGDSLVFQTIGDPSGATSTRGKVKAALELLFNDHQVGTDTDHNALAQSFVTVDSVNIVGDTQAIIALSGQLRLGGECDNPRVQAQIEKTALAVNGITAVDITLNGRPLAEALSLK